MRWASRNWVCGVGIGAAVAVGAVVGCVGEARACPDLDRVVGPYEIGLASTLGGTYPFGVRAADDFELENRNGQTYQVRVVRFVMLANYAITPSNVNFSVYTDGNNGTRPVPGQFVYGSWASRPRVRAIGQVNQTYSAYEVMYVLAGGELTLEPGRYWISPQSIGYTDLNSTPPFFGTAFVASSTSSTVFGEKANTAQGVPPNGVLSPWLLPFCCAGPGDLAVYIDAVTPDELVSDINCDQTGSVQDIFDFLALWFGGRVSADVNLSGDVTVQDIFDYLAKWFAGE